MGKGVTFDCGGYNIKTGPGCMIEMMKFDSELPLLCCHSSAAAPLLPLLFCCSPVATPLLLVACCNSSVAAACAGTKRVSARCHRPARLQSSVRAGMGAAVCLQWAARALCWVRRGR